MLSTANVLLLDEPTNHLDLESITALNNGLINFKVHFYSHHMTISLLTRFQRLMEITPNGLVDKQMSYSEYVADRKLQEKLNI